ncbi:MAG: Aldehyde dehydrogenase [Acidimicrobiales bacterium]|nr:MAG: aldehyde dehydrogenase family protein [Actinomycetota bacterium]MBV6507884.1 Aldehyde dehydrogenase [Acidimicrobiales bacterium]RIK06028.1 MAG: aldehyde dehydrogenase family protein [Acidobacteriota bacterium]
MTDTAQADTAQADTAQADTAQADTAQADTAQAYDQLLDGLRKTFRSGRTRSLDWRRDQLDALLALLDENEKPIMDALAEDLGRPPTEAYGADIGQPKLEIRHARKNLERWARPRRVLAPLTSQPGRAKIVAEPLGVALVISPWNYPIQLLVNPLAAALAAGNCVVAKPSELAPACSALLAGLVTSYLDTDAVAVIEGGVPETSALLEQRFDHVFFTGSTRVGQVVMEAAAKHLTPVTLELGGKSPTIVAADADLAVAARRITWGKYLNAGQTCIAPDYVLAEASIRDELVERMVDVLGEFYGPDPRSSASYGRIVNQSHFDRLVGLLGGDGAGEIVCGGEHDREQRFIAPTIVIDPSPSAPVMQDEIFGPVLPVLRVEDVGRAVEFVNDRPKPLALYLFSSSADTVEDVIEQTSSGGACVNHCVVHVLPSNLPFGGVGPSGMGAYHGKAGFDAFSHRKPVLTKPIWPDPKVMYPPYTELKDKVLRKAL